MRSLISSSTWWGVKRKHKIKSPINLLLFLFSCAGLAVCCLNFYSGVFFLPNHLHAQYHFLGSTFQTTVITAGGDNGKTANEIFRRAPTHQACEGYQGIYHIAMTDILGGVGTALIQLVLGQIMYAQDHRLKPWVYLNNQSEVFYDLVVHSADGVGGGVQFKAMVGRNATHVYPSRQGYRNRRDQVPGPLNTSIQVTQQTLTFSDTDGIWQHYFDPVSDFVPGDRSCESKLYVTMDLYLITPGIHGFASDYATRSWRYDYLPEYVTQPHVPLHEWFLPQRQRAHETLSKYIRFKPYLQKMAQQANPGCNLQSNSCLGLHIRHSDKAAGRRQIPVEEFRVYAEAFVQEGGQQIYVATDSLLVLQEIQQSWPTHVKSRIRSLGQNAIRSKDTKAVFDMASHHTTNQEALVEILALSYCQFMVHGLSAVSESSIWINLDLHYRSVNLEDTDHIDAETFATLVKLSHHGEPVTKLPLPPQTNKFYNQLLLPESSSTKDASSCDGFVGVLHIAAVARGSGPSHAFFTSIANQLLLAERFNLKPWIHLSGPPAMSSILHDPKAHVSVNATKRTSGYQQLQLLADKNEWHLPHVDAVNSPTVQIPGSNLWSVYFEPIGPDWNHDSCTNKPLFVLDSNQVTEELEKRTQWAIRPWRLDGVEDAIWNPSNQKRWNEILWNMRQTGNRIVSQYLHVREPIRKRAAEVNPIHSSHDATCLAVHIRITDKAGTFRQAVASGKYIPYMEAFVRAGGTILYIGTDSSRALRYLFKTLPEHVSSKIRTQGKFIVRSSSKTVPPYALDHHHRVNSETLVDLYAMAQCQFLVHSSSASAEAVIYLNLDLHNKSVNLEDPNRLSPDEFESLVKKSLKGK